MLARRRRLPPQALGTSPAQRCRVPLPPRRTSCSSGSTRPRCICWSGACAADHCCCCSLPRGRTAPMVRALLRVDSFRARSGCCEISGCSCAAAYHRSRSTAPIRPFCSGGGACAVDRCRYVSASRPEQGWCRAEARRTHVVVHNAAWRHGADRACSHKGTAGLGRVVGMRARWAVADGGLEGSCARRQSRPGSEAIRAREARSGVGGATEGGSKKRGMQLSEGGRGTI